MPIRSFRNNTYPTFRITPSPIFQWTKKEAEALNREEKRGWNLGQKKKTGSGQLADEKRKREQNQSGKDMERREKDGRKRTVVGTGGIGGGKRV